MFRKLHTLKEIRRQHIGSQIGRFLVFCIGLTLGLYANIQGMPVYITIIVIAGFLFMAMEHNELAN